MAWHRCHFVSFMMMSLVPSLKNTASIFLEVFFIQYFTMANLMTSSVSKFPYYKNVNMSRMKKKKYSKKEMPFFCILKICSNYFSCHTHFKMFFYILLLFFLILATVEPFKNKIVDHTSTDQGKTNGYPQRSFVREFIGIY